MACCRTWPTNSITCSHVGPTSLESLVVPPGGFDQPSLSPSREDVNDELLENAHPAPPQLRWRRVALQPPEIQRVRLAKDTCVHVPDGGLRCVTWNTRGLIGSPHSPQSSRERKTHLLHSGYPEQRHRMSTRNLWERCVSPGYSGTRSAIPAIWHFYPEQFERRWTGYLHS